MGVEGLRVMDDLDRMDKTVGAHFDVAKPVAQDEVNEEIKQLIERDLADPRQQTYMVNPMSGRLVRTNEQYHRMLENGVKQDQIQYVNYNTAAGLYQREESDKKQAARRVMERKRVKQARKKNRAK